MKRNMKKLLLHTCCGPCFLGTWEDLLYQDIEITCFFYNPNIHPEDEFNRREEALNIATRKKAKEIITVPYEPNEYYTAIDNLTVYPERCERCYTLRLEKTAKTAKEKGYDAFSTTLLVSPYQDHEKLISICKKLGKKYEIEFYYSDFRKNFKLGQAIARDQKIYRQKYCGCTFSKLEAANRLLS